MLTKPTCKRLALVPFSLPTPPRYSHPSLPSPFFILWVWKVKKKLTLDVFLDKERLHVGEWMRRLRFQQLDSRRRCGRVYGRKGDYNSTWALRLAYHDTSIEPRCVFVGVSVGKTRFMSRALPLFLHFSMTFGDTLGEYCISLSLTMNSMYNVYFTVSKKFMDTILLLRHFSMLR